MVFTWATRMMNDSEVKTHECRIGLICLATPTANSVRGWENSGANCKVLKSAKSNWLVAFLWLYIGGSLGPKYNAPFTS
jgi:hypothetical protein